MQTPVAAMNATRQTMIRTRSSVRCSTRLSRSSCPICRRAAAMLSRYALTRRALADDLALERGRLGRVGLGERRADVGVFLVVVVVVLAGDRILELAHAGAELAPEAG